ncbi:cilia- and flagella-associated protein [Histomonas meleagridis]|uniref:cilia- and flagella-associated protein 73 n=1 Tax=Histomonas meleagridis TaxID=135588 RepID=UPI00355A6290|nr:cilia- and flagella-associated protein [Histomonas meleagridis]KAH0799243.1 cilia- and flagella-associated protein 73 [Histomonas meleagridis]
MDKTFLTRPQKQKYELRNLERYGTTGYGNVGYPELSPHLIEKQKEMEIVDQQLEEARNKYEAWKKNFEVRKKEVEDKQHALDEQKKRLDAFTAQQMSSLEKTRKRRAEEAERLKSIEIELQQLMEEEKQLKQKNEKLQNKIEKLRPYSNYLQSVVDAYPSFENIDAILNRYQSLADTRNEYLQKYQNMMERYGIDETNLSRELELKKSKLIDTTMKFNENVAKVAQAKKANEYVKATLIKDIQRIEDKKAELAAIKASIRAIYSRAVSTLSTISDKAQKAKGSINDEQMLEYIENRFNDLKGIIEDKNALFIPSAPPELIQRVVQNPVSSAKR